MVCMLACKTMVESMDKCNVNEKAKLFEFLICESIQSIGPIMVCLLACKTTVESMDKCNVNEKAKLPSS
jgi:hypothetical protein